MEQKELLNLVFQGKKDFGVKCKKFAGTLTVEVLKHALEKHGFPISPRDVFIRGVNAEIDLIISRKKELNYGVFFESEDVLAALEVKELGSFGEQTINQVRKNFELIRQINENVFCAYVTLTERKGFKWAVTTENLGFPAYTLFWHKGNDIENGDSSGDFGRLLDDLRKITS